MLNKMKLSNENLVDILKRIAFVCNERHVKHLKYISNEILHDIESSNSAIVRSIRTLLLFDKIILFSVEKMLSLVWNHMTKREQIRQNVIQRMQKSKQRMKVRYDKEVNVKMFTFNQYVFLLNINFIFKKNTSRWRKSFVIADKASEHNFNYKFL